MDNSWMHADRRSKDYRDGVDEFLKSALKYAANREYISCPCIKCGNLKKFSPEVVKEHLFFSGVDTSYKDWIWHGQVAVDVDEASSFKDETQYGDSAETVDMRFQDYEECEDETFNFMKVIEDGDKPLYPGCTTFTKLGTLVRWYNLKAKHGMTDACFSDVLLELGRVLPEGNEIPSSVHEAKKTLRALGMEYNKIHACLHDCILYRNEHENLTSCPTCGHSRWLVTKDGVMKKGVPAKVLWYFPPIPRFKRWFQSCETAKDLTWHANRRVTDGLMTHPADSPSWKLVDHMWPEFANDPRNLQLALSTDGFNPHGSLSSGYSCWPVMLVNYNLPPDLCMKRKFIMLSLLISGPSQPGNDIDVYLAPLIEDLKTLWDGVPRVYDAHIGEYFTLKAVLMWTINDFPAYSNLSGSVVHGYNACPICIDETKPTRLVHGNKMSYIGSRRFLPRYHPYRRQRVAFNNLQEFSAAPVPLTGEEVLDRVKDINYKFGKKVYRKPPGPKDPKPVWKKKSIFFELEYWKFHYVRHNLDVMHVEKNCLEAVLGTILDIPGKTKDGLAARLDMLDMGIRTDLKPKDGEKRSKLPMGSWNLFKEEKISVCKSFHGMKVPEGYSSNIRSLVNLEELKLGGLKSHDCHTLMQQLLPIAIRGVLDKPVRYAITRLCLFFNALCSKVIDVSEIDKIQEDLVVTLCELEKYFPPSFFDIMIHLTLHLMREVKLCGPVYFRWMYPFERYMRVLKGYVKNRYRVEGAMAECSNAEEAIEVCTEFLGDATTVGIPASLKADTRALSGASFECVDRRLLEKAHLYVLHNSNEVEPYVIEHKAIVLKKYPKYKKDPKWLLKKHNQTFSEWFRHRVAHELESEEHGISETVKWLADGPSDRVPKFQGYRIKGVSFNTYSRDVVRASQNSGVKLVANTMSVNKSTDKKPITSNLDFYGVIQEIWELDYDQFMETVFLCDWVSHKHGFKVEAGGLTFVDLTKIDHGTDPFVSATQVVQVFYVEDPSDAAWSAVLGMPDRLYNDEDLEDNVIDHQPLYYNMPPVHNVDDVLGDVERTFARSGDEGIWVDK